MRVRDTKVFEKKRRVIVHMSLITVLVGPCHMRSYEHEQRGKKPFLRIASRGFFGKHSWIKIVE